jgi:2,4-dienoyl-CoA reductase-like NADH-dependent reductase (Old Yellow Enzyme family)
MSEDVIFTPLRFRNLTVKNRIFRSNISGRFDNEDGSLTQTRINWENSPPPASAPSSPLMCPC